MIEDKEVIKKLEDWYNNPTTCTIVVRALKGE